MKINAFSATLADDERVGLCFEPKIALANHSCCPNAIVVFNGRTVSLRALNTIKSSEQIFISYIDPTQSTDERLTQLSKRYFFTCECLKCRGSHTGRGETPYHTFRRYVSEGHYVGSPPRTEVLCNLDNTISTATVRLASSNPLLTYIWNIDAELYYRNASMISIPNRLSKLNSQQQNESSMTSNPTTQNDASGLSKKPSGTTDSPPIRLIQQSCMRCISTVSIAKNPRRTFKHL
jgi:hypothetical protein